MSENVKNKEDDLGALWRKQGRVEYLSGFIKVGTERVRVVVFEQRKKNKDTDPDFVIKKSTYQPNTTTNTRTKPAVKSTSPRQTVQDETNDGDLL